MTATPVPPSSKVTAVVVTYHPDPATLAAQVKRLAGQVERLLLLDNGSGNAAEIAAFASEHDWVEFIGADSNRGLGWAHNEGIRRGLADGADAILLLDQDSLPRPGMVAALARALVGQRQRGVQVAAVGARYLGSDIGHPSYFVQFRPLRFRHHFCTEKDAGEIIPADMLISSGALFPREALLELGLMDEDLFIDHVDTEWFLRAKDRGWRVFGVCDAVMDHGLGERTVMVWLGRWRYLPIHQPFRYYYIYRNSVLLYRRSYPSRRWKHTDMLRLAKMFVVFSLFAGNRRQNLRMMCRGLADGFKGRSGPIDADLPR